MPGRPWTRQEAVFVTTWLPYRTVPAIAAALGRTEKAVRRWCERHGHYATTELLMRSGRAARLAGCTPQRLTALARAGRIRARRVPGGRWWLFAVADLPDQRSTSGGGVSPRATAAQ